MHKKYADYFQYRDSPTKYDKLGVAPRSPVHPQPSRPTFARHSTLSVFFPRTFANFQLFLTESTSSFKFEKRLNEDYKRNFTALEQKCKQDIQSMQKALNAQWHQYEQMVHTTSIKRIM